VWSWALPTDARVDRGWGRGDDAAVGVQSEYCSVAIASSGCSRGWSRRRRAGTAGWWWSRGSPGSARARCWARRCVPRARAACAAWWRARRSWSMISRLVSRGSFASHRSEAVRIPGHLCDSLRTNVNVRTVLYQVIGTLTRPRGPYTLSQQLADEVVKGERFARMTRDKDPMAESVGPAAADPGRGVAALRVVLLALSTNVASSLVPQEWRQRGLHREERGNAPGWDAGGGGLGAGCWSDGACAALRGWGKGRLPQSAATAKSSRRAK
jgi:hypothetical protein